MQEYQKLRNELFETRVLIEQWEKDSTNHKEEIESAKLRVEEIRKELKHLKLEEIQEGRMIK